MSRRDWFSLVSVHCDLWLLSVSFYNGSSLNRNERERLFSLINDLPTVYNILKRTVASGIPLFLRLTKRYRARKGKSIPKVDDEDEDEDDESFCGSCGGNYSVDEFWICCDTCDRWFHGKCVKITFQMAESIDKYKCPSCSMDMAGQATD